MVTSPDYFYIDGKSSADIGLYVDTPPPPPSAQPRYDRIQRASLNDLVSPIGSYDDVSYTITAYTFGDGKDFNNNDIYAFLSGGKELRVSRYPDFYYKIHEISSITPKSSYNGKRIQYSITFTLAPFKYALAPTTIEIPDSLSYSFDNAGSVYCEPIIIIKMKEGQEEIIKGDVNFDGRINAVDASLVLAEYAAVSTGRPSTLTEKQRYAADVNGDGKIDSVDASLILEMYSQSMTTDPFSRVQTVQIIVNGATLYVGIPSEVRTQGKEVYVDCERNLIYYLTNNDTQMVNILHYSSLDLPLFHTGRNTISYRGEGVEKVTVIANERWV